MSILEDLATALAESTVLVSTDNPNLSRPRETIPTPESYIGAAIGIILEVCGLFGNALLLMVIATNRNLRTLPNTFICSLAICELIFLLSRYVVDLDVYVKTRWELGIVPCHMSVVLLTGLSTTEVLHILVITGYRYLLICRPFIYEFARRKYIIVGLIVGLYALPFLGLIGRQSQYWRSKFVMHEDLILDVENVQCIHVEQEASSIVYVVAFLLVLTGVLMLMYWRIYIAAKRSHRTIVEVVQKNMRFDSHSGTVSASNSTNSNATSKTTTLSKSMMRREVRLSKSMVVIMIVFIVTYLPIVTKYEVSSTTQLEIPYWLHLVVNLIRWAGLSGCWIVYGAMNPQFRLAYRSVIVKVLGCGCRCRRSRLVGSMPKNDVRP